MRELKVRINVKVCKFCEDLTEQNHFHCLDKTKGYTVFIKVLNGLYMVNVSGHTAFEKCHYSANLFLKITKLNSTRNKNRPHLLF